MAPAMHKMLIYVFPAMTGTVMLFWPGCMQITFFTTAVLSLSQSWLLRQPWLRQYLGLQPLPPPSTKSPPRTPYTGTMNTYQPPAKTASLPEKKGIIGGAISDIKGAAGQAVTSAKGALAIDQDAKKTRGRSSEELRRAKLYEEKRRREIAQEQFDKSQQKRTRRE
jgi:YidC/Oxa1 family membrane protein insertase